MKKRLTKVLGVAVSLALLTSLFAVLPAAAVSIPSVVLSNGVISQTSNYTITFDVVATVPDAGTITIQLPVGTAVPATGAWGGAAPADITLQATAGFGTQIPQSDISGANIITTAGTTTVGPKVAILCDVSVLGDLPNAIGEGATVRIKFNNLVVTNPPAIADYTLTVLTDQTGDTTAVASQVYALAAPTVGALPGIVQIYNSSGILMGSWTGGTAFATAMPLAGADFTIKIGPGTYAEVVASSAARQTFTATSTAADTILNAGLTIGDDGVTVEGLTLNGLVAINESDATIKDCVIAKSGGVVTAGETLVTVNNINTSGDTTPTASITDCTFDTTLQHWVTGAVQDIGVDVLVTSVGSLTISGCTFSVDATTAGLPDTAILTAAGGALAPVTVTGCTITGASGIGVNVTAGVTSITDSTLSTLAPALSINGGTTTVKDSTITGCGVTATATVAGVPAVLVTGVDAAVQPTVTITNSIVTGSLDDLMLVTDTTPLGGSANAGLITVMFNDLSGNVLGIDNNDPTAANTVNATINWWGDADGPAAAFNGGSVNAAGATGGVAEGSVTTTTGTLNASTTQGVAVEITIGGAAWAPVAGDIIAVGRYTANPQSDTPEPALADGYYDVYLVDTTAAAGTLVTIKLYNDAITDETVAYVWSELQGDWAPCSSQGVNTFGGFVWVRVTAAATSVPTILDLLGTPFALASIAEEEEAPAAPAVLTPTFGGDDVPLKPTFTWTASENATSYEFVLAEEIGQDDKFAIIDYSATTSTHGHVARETLKYNTVYNWRVRAVSDVGSGDWTIGFFTTMTEPEPEPEPTPAVIVKETPPTPAPEIILQVPPAEVEQVQVIPDVLLWVVVAIGAVLIIAVVALIVRTRRVA